VNYKFINIDRCPNCNDKDSILWDNNTKNEIKALECKKCTLVYMDKILSNKDLIKFYDTYNSSRNMNNKIKKNQRKKMYELDYNELSLIVPEKGIFLDIGCGEGDFLSYFQNIRKLGYDIDQNATLNGSKVNKDIEFIDYLESVKNQELNCVIFRGTLQYMRNINQSIKYSYDKLIDNGYLCIFSLPNTDSPLARLQRENWSMCNKIEHIQLFNINSLDFLLRNKFKIIHISFPYLGTPYENHNNDLQLIIDIINNKNGALKKNFPFWGSLMNIIAKKI
jgi:ubiquinone/menaquinone biosynthesis C-methylase UbiE